MAFCGVTFDNEVKEQALVMGHTLKGVVGLTGNQKQDTTSEQEGLLIWEKNVAVDRRTKITFGDKKFHLLSYEALCQMKMQVRPGLEAVGSCSRIRIGLQSFIFTCAHNLVIWNSFKDRGVNVQAGFAYSTRQGEDSWAFLFKIRVKDILVHPKYDGQPDCGFDFGIAPVIPEKHENSKGQLFASVNDVEWGPVKPETIEVGLKIEVAGFPAEKKGYPYVHSGKIVAKKKTKLGGWVIYYDVDTTLGNSGSDINVIDKAWVRKYSLTKNKTKVSIGCHTGHCNAEGLNYGTLLTPEIYNWCKNKVREKKSLLQNNN